MSRWFPGFSGGRRSIESRLFAGCGVEGLQSRCLLSAVMSHGKGIAAEVSPLDAGVEIKHQRQDAHQEADTAAKKPKAPKYPDLSGQWRAITHLPGEDVIGVLQLTQHKKKLTGTLTNEGQPPGKFKAKIIVTEAPSSKISSAAGATPQKQVKIQGEIQNFSAWSDPIPFESDSDPWDLPDPPDLPDPWDEPFDVDFDPPPPDWEDLPDLPDMEFDPIDFPPPSPPR